MLRIGLSAIVVALLSGLVWIVAVQNAHQTATLRLDLGGAVGAWEMVEAWPVVGLMGLACGVGAALGGVGTLVVGSLWRRRANRGASDASR